MDWGKRLAALAGAVLFGWCGTAQAAPALWRVTDADSQVYLFGAVHALRPGLKWRTPLYDAVLARADTVWFEADMESGDPDTVRLLIQRYGSDPDRPLSRKLAPSDLEALSRRTDVARVDHLRPWAAALMLSVRPVVGKGATVENGVDLTITRAARNDRKRVRTFETLEDQAKMFAGLPERSEVQYLNRVVRGESQRLRLPGKAANLEAAWLAGKLGPDAVADMQARNPALYEALLKRRNHAWAERLTAEIAATAGVQLVNVGALHMIGADGLPALLAARGYRVERVQ